MGFAGTAGRAFTGFTHPTALVLRETEAAVADATAHARVAAGPTDLLADAVEVVRTGP